MAALLARELDTASAVVDFAREQRRLADEAEAQLLGAAVQWAAMHSVDSIEDAACFGDTPVPVAGTGAPLVAEFSIHEFATAIGLPTEVGKTYVGEAVELRHRLPRLWRRVQRGDLPAWRARRIARTTMCLSAEAAAFVDAKVAAFAHRIGPSAVDRLIDEAIARYMPDEAAARAEQAAEHRRFDIHTRHVSTDGTVDVTGTLDLADALDLDAAVTQIATGLKECGSDATLDVRRAQAVGELARRQLAFDFQPQAGKTDKQVTLHVHVREGDPVAHLDSLPLMLEQVKDWCRDGNVTVKPVVDLNQRLETDAYEIPDRIRDQVLLINPTCVFPHCSRKSRALDLDHVIPWPLGPTATDNLAPLCRSHHRAKTFGGWRYRVITPGTYAWRSPHGYTYRTDRSGTTHTGPDPDR
jgi:5-methylcytosine-specific restriction endonuclease McrA